jgi:multiple sugar transport system substrate-binding protein
MWQAMRDSGACVPADLQALDQLNIETSMVSLGHAAVSFAHSNQIVGFQSVNKSPLVMLTKPTGGPGSKPGQYRKPSMFFSAYTKSGVPTDSAKFISYFVNDPAATEVLGVERGVPESAPVREALKKTLDELGRAQIEYVDGLGDLAGPLPPPPPSGAGEIAFSLKRINEEVGFGTAPEEGADSLITEANSILARG